MLMLTVFAAFLLVVASESQPSPNETTHSTHQPGTCQPCPDATTVPPSLTVAPSSPTLAVINVRGKAGQCLGDLYLVVFDSTQRAPLCYNSHEKLHIFQKTLCAQLGCGTFQKWSRSTSNSELAYTIMEKGFLQNNTTCGKLRINCEALPESRQLVGYKTVTGLLITTFLILVLLRFAPGRCTSLCNKLFKRRNREWIGPTESQTVSFYRAQGGIPPNSNTKRHSYPALERLAVHQSREPSSNRNSDCDSYN